MKTKKTMEQISKQLERIWRLHFKFNVGSKALFERADRIGYGVISRMTY